MPVNWQFSTTTASSQSSSSSPSGQSSTPSQTCSLARQDVAPTLPLHGNSHSALGGGEEVGGGGGDGGPGGGGDGGCPHRVCIPLIRNPL